MTSAKKRIAIFIVAYNAVKTLSRVLARIPFSVKERVEEIYVFDDSSKDDTYLVGVGYKHVSGTGNLNIYRHPKNLGYGGNQKAGYDYAIEKGHDIVVLLHGDGQYAPEVIEDLIIPLENDEVDAVFGSRMIEKGAARKGGMPFYKLLGNKILTYFENKMLNLHLSEFHSGYRAYSTAAIKKIPYHLNSNDFHFDTEIIIQLHANGFRLKEVSIPTYYGEEICYVNGIKYAYNVFRSVLQYKLHEVGLREYEKYRNPLSKYRVKRSIYDSHQRIASKVRIRGKVLDVGCGDGLTSRFLNPDIHYVVGVDIENHSSSPNIKEFFQKDIETDFALPFGKEFDFAILADVLEHVRNPKLVLEEIKQYLRDQGQLIVSLPNFCHWYVRIKVLFGRFEYQNRGILDHQHLRFFTLETIKRMLGESGYQIKEVEGIPIPFSLILHKNSPGLCNFFYRFNLLAIKLLKRLFAYQFILVAGLKEPLHSGHNVSERSQKIVDSIPKYPG
jgi:methionine biosynthesis protein MetW